MPSSIPQEETVDKLRLGQPKLASDQRYVLAQKHSDPIAEIMGTTAARMHYGVAPGMYADRHFTIMDLSTQFPVYTHRRGHIKTASSCKEKDVGCRQNPQYDYNSCHRVSACVVPKECSLGALLLPFIQGGGLIEVPRNKCRRDHMCEKIEWCSW